MHRRATVNLRSRLAKIETAVRAAVGRVPWFSLKTWLREEKAGVPIEEQERRRLAEHPEHAGEIRRYHALWRRRQAELDAVEDFGDTMGPETDDDGGDANG